MRADTETSSDMPGENNPSDRIAEFVDLPREPGSTEGLRHWKGKLISIVDLPCDRVEMPLVLDFLHLVD
ncbi:MAG: hypothetical protein DRP71_13345 [Verrucomicrobia bacterium]|nr:MAG: hypothetical protein DRP71_13345 [Verrucomicrobiota bacterium]